MEHPAQVVATVSNIMWTYYTEYTINSMAEDSSALAEWYN
jgi:dynein heavy chain